MNKLRHLLHRAIVRYLRSCGGTFHAFPYGKAGAYVTVMTDEEYHRFRNPDAGLDAWFFLRPKVRFFAAAMERELRAHDDRPGWKDEEPCWLLGRLYDEADELFDLVHDLRYRGNGTIAPRILGEAADVANFAMMLADVAGALPAGGVQ